MNRDIMDRQKDLNRTLKRARQISRQPGDVDPHGGGGMFETASSTPTIETVPGPDGAEYPPAIWDVDNWDEAVWS